MTRKTSIKQLAAPEDFAIQPADHLVVLEKGLMVIESFDGHEALTVSEVAALTGLSRAAARRCLLTLTALGYASQDGKAFRLAPRILRLGFAYLSRADLPRMLQPALEQLSRALGESASASVLDGTEVLYVARVATVRIISVELRAGSRLPAYCNAMGRVLLAARPPAEVRAILKRSDLVQRTPRTLTGIRPLMAAIDVVRRQGYSVVQGELELGLLTIAVPIFDAAGVVVAAINVGAHVDRTDERRLVGEALPRMRKIQRDIGPLLR